MTTKTFRLSGKAMDRPWHVIDAKGRPLGRVASEAARLLMGKHKPTYERHLPMGDFVIIVNAREVAVTGNKSLQKVYYRHSGYPGGLHQRTLQQQMERDPRRVLERAVKGMLPSTSLGRELFRHLKVYAGPTHPHEAQVRAGASSRPKRIAGTPEASVSPPPEEIAMMVAAEEPAEEVVLANAAAEDDIIDTGATSDNDEDAPNDEHAEQSE